MRIRFRYLMAAAAVAAMVGAPVAAAQPHSTAAQAHQTCTAQGPRGIDVVCSSPGNVQINDSLPVWHGGFTGLGFGFYPGGPYAVPFAHR